MAFGPAAFATTMYTGTFPNRGGSSGTLPGTFANFGASGITLTAYCGTSPTPVSSVGDYGCQLSNAVGSNTSGGGIGVNSKDDGIASDVSNPIQGGLTINSVPNNNEYILFKFASGVTLDGVSFDLIGSSNTFDIYNCGTDATCSSPVLLGTDTQGANSTFATNGGDFTPGAGQYFEVSAASATTEFGIESITFSTPEPATLGLVGISLLGLGGLHLRRNKRMKRGSEPI
jgi:hypothetical protein